MQCKTKSENLANILGYQIWAVTGAWGGGCAALLRRCVVQGRVWERGDSAGRVWGRGGAERRRPKGGVAVWHGHASGDHHLGHARSGISMFLSALWFKWDGVFSTVRQNQDPTTLLTKLSANSKVGATKNSEKQYWSKREYLFWANKTFFGLAKIFPRGVYPPSAGF